MTALSVVASAVYDLEGRGAPRLWKGMHGPIDLAAACWLGPAARSDMKDCAVALSDQVMMLGEG